MVVRQLHDVAGGILERDELAPAGQRDWIVEGPLPTFGRHDQVRRRRLPDFPHWSAGYPVLACFGCVTLITATPRNCAYPCDHRWREWSRSKDKQETTMAEFKTSERKNEQTSDRNEHTSLDDAELAAVVGGSPSAAEIKAVFAKPTLGTYH